MDTSIISPAHSAVITSIAPSSTWNAYALTSQLGTDEDSGLASSMDFEFDPVEQLQLDEWTNLASYSDTMNGEFWEKACKGGWFLGMSLYFEYLNISWARCLLDERNWLSFDFFRLSDATPSRLMGDNVEKDKRPPLVEPFLLFAGGCSALASRLVVHPCKAVLRVRALIWESQYSATVDTVRVRIQTYPPGKPLPTSLRSLIGAPALPKLYAGMPVALGFSVPALAVYLTTYEGKVYLLVENKWIWRCSKPPS
jgi:hypothetical protein